MSFDLYSTGLRWASGRGMAKLHGRVAPLTEPPLLCGNRVHAVDYVPEIHLREIQHRAVDRVVDMTDDEVRAADALLAQLTQEKRA